MQKNNNCDNEGVVLNELIKNSRQSNSSIAKKVGLSRQSVIRIIKNLEKRGTIWGYTTITSEDAGFCEKENHYVALVKVKDIAQALEEIKRVVKEKGNDILFKKDNLQFVYSAIFHGQYDILTIFKAKSLIEAKKFMSLMQKKFPNIIDIDLLQPLLIIRYGSFPNPHLEKNIDKIL